MKSFIVKSKDIFDPKKNPHFSLSARDILKNKKIKKYNDGSKYFSDWTTKKLKQEAKGYYQTIHQIGCYGVRDLIALDRILIELSNRGIEPTYIKTLNF